MDSEKSHEMTTNGGSTVDCTESVVPCTTVSYSGINKKPSLNRIIESTGGNK